MRREWPGTQEIEFVHAHYTPGDVVPRTGALLAAGCGLVVGPYCSAEVELVARAFPNIVCHCPPLSHQHASSLTYPTRTQPPFVSFTASGVALGDRARFPMFHRLAASDSAQVGAIAAVLRSLNVTAAALLAISDVYGLFAMSLLDAALRSAGVAAAHRQFFSPSLRITSTTDTEPLRATVSVSRSPVLSVPSRLSHTYCVVLFSAARCCRVQRHHRRHVLSLALVLSRSPACRVCPFPLHLFCSP